MSLNILGIGDISLLKKESKLLLNICSSCLIKYWEVKSIRNVSDFQLEI